MDDGLAIQSLLFIPEEGSEQDLWHMRRVAYFSRADIDALSGIKLGHVYIELGHVCELRSQALVLVVVMKADCVDAAGKVSHTLTIYQGAFRVTKTTFKEWLTGATVDGSREKRKAMEAVFERMMTDE